MSVTKNSNQNQLQQVEIRLCHVYFHRTATPRCQLRMQVEDIARSVYGKTLAYTTGTTSKHQRATCPELYRKFPFLRV